MLDGKPFYITSDLPSTLLATQYNNTILRFWINKTCINFIKKKEYRKRVATKNHIYQIYKYTTNACIWLGNDNKPINICMRVVFVFYRFTKLKQMRGRRNSKLEGDWDIVYSTIQDMVKWRFIFEELRNIISRKRDGIS